MSNPVDTYPTGTDQVVPLPHGVPTKDPAKAPDGEVPMEPNPYMGGGGIPA